MGLRFPWFSRRAAFAFHNPGVLRDGEFELVAPHVDWIDAVLASTRHPATQRESRSLPAVSRQSLMDYVNEAPAGHESPQPFAIEGPAYRFWMRDRNNLELPMAGGIVLRIGNTPDLLMYYGHVGYHVYPPHRGRHFAERAVRLLLPLAMSHKLDPMWITCNPDNWASRRTCERAGGKLVEIVDVPRGHALFERGETQKCRYVFNLA